MIIVRISLMKVAAAAKQCAQKHFPPFSMRRLTSPFDWIPERQRFAFGRDE